MECITYVRAKRSGGIKTGVFMYVCVCVYVLLNQIGRIEEERGGGRGEGLQFIVYKSKVNRVVVIWPRDLTQQIYREIFQKNLYI